MNELTEAEAALAAMNRAAESARVRASRFGSRLALWKDGSVVLVEPLANDAEEAADQPAAVPKTKSEGEEKSKPRSDERPR